MSEQKNIGGVIADALYKHALHGTIALCALRAAGIIDWSAWAILSPMLAYLATGLACTLLLGILTAIGGVRK